MTQQQYRIIERREHLRWFVRVIEAVLRSQLERPPPGVANAPGALAPSQAANVWQLLANVPVRTRSVCTTCIVMDAGSRGAPLRVSRAY